MAQQFDSHASSPESLYAQCLQSYVASLSYDVSTLDNVQRLRYLPSGVLIDVYVMISECDQLKDMLLEQLSDLEVFERLLRFDPARQKLFRCLSALMSSNRALAAQLQQRYTGRYQMQPTTAATTTTTGATGATGAAAKPATKSSKPLANAKATKMKLKLTTTTGTSMTAPSTSATAAATAPAAATTTTTTTLAVHAATPAAAEVARATTTTSAGTATTAEITATPTATPTATATPTPTATAREPTTEHSEQHNETSAEVQQQQQQQQSTDDQHGEADKEFADVLEQVDALAKDAEPLSEDTIDFGMRLGSFLSEAGWLSESIAILQCVAARLRHMKPLAGLQVVRLDCLQRLLHSEAALCNFKSAERTFNEIYGDLLPSMAADSIPKSLLANTYIQFSAMYFARSEYDDSHTWSWHAMRHLDEHTPERIVVDVLRQASKACVVKRDFQRANMLICQASNRARKVFGMKHQKYADTLLDYGFFLLNVDSVYQSVSVYKDALEIKRAIFGNRNFHVAIAHEDLSYAYYVHEYSTGNFTCARDHVERAVDIMKDLVPSDHLMLASARRVKALLLEEIALDKMADGVYEDSLLAQSEELHKFALQLSLEVFGEVNVQTAKHYGNLGRLYQTMNRFEEAECMHQKAIKIKTLLLGPFDYEVGLSIGHLASLYNYQMKKYREAEDLYLRSIDISIRLFGRSYSGLEYDYLGLCHVYEKLREFEKYLKYATILENWQMLRVQNNGRNKTFYPAANEDYSLADVKYQFFNMCTTNKTTAAACE